MHPTTANLAHKVYSLCSGKEILSWARRCSPHTPKSHVTLLTADSNSVARNQMFTSLGTSPFGNAAREFPKPLYVMSAV